VIQNLVTNAVQSIDGKGAVTLRTLEENGRVVFSVTDTGAACRRSSSASRSSLVPIRQEGRLEAHRGTIEVSSKEGTATTFTVGSPLRVRVDDSRGQAELLMVDDRYLRDSEAACVEVKFSPRRVLEGLNLGGAAGVRHTSWIRRGHIFQTGASRNE